MASLYKQLQEVRATHQNSNACGTSENAACCAGWRVSRLTYGHKGGWVSHNKADSLSGLVADVRQEKANASSHGQSQGPAYTKYCLPAD
jgi:hypothetical protein